MYEDYCEEEIIIEPEEDPYLAAESRHGCTRCRYVWEHLPGCPYTCPKTLTGYSAEELGERDREIIRAYEECLKKL